MKDNKRITQLMLELYHLNAVTKKERKFIKEALSSDNEVRLRYEEIINLDREINNKYLSDKTTVFAVINNNNTEYKKINIKIIIGAGIAAVLCLCITAFLFLNNIFKKDINIEFAENDNADHLLVDNKEQERIDIQGLLSVRGSVDHFNDESDVYIPTNIASISTNMYAGRGLCILYIPPNILTIESGAFADNPLIRITIGEGIDVADDALPGNFSDIYKNNGKASGVYTRFNNSNEWSKR